MLVGGVLPLTLAAPATSQAPAARDTARAPLRAPFRIEAAGRPIDVGIGHAAPLVTDWDGDGVRDLLVGQFEGGQLRIYLNRGTDAAPRFEDFAYFQTRKKLGSIPAG